MSIRALTSLIAVLAAGAASAQIEPDEAETRIREACKAEEGTDPEKCDCYVDELKSVLPESTYKPMITLAAAVMSQDRDLMQSFLDDRDLEAGQFNEMVLEMERALSTAEGRCEPADSGADSETDSGTNSGKNPDNDSDSR